MVVIPTQVGYKGAWRGLMYVSQPVDSFLLVPHLTQTFQTSTTGLTPNHNSFRNLTENKCLFVCFCCQKPAMTKQATSNAVKHVFVFCLYCFVFVHTCDEKVFVPAGPSGLCCCCHRHYCKCSGQNIVVVVFFGFVKRGNCLYVYSQCN